MATGVPIRVFVPNPGLVPGAQGTIALCHKRPGDKVAAEDALFDIEFDEIDAAVLAPVTGTLVGVHVDTGDKVTTGRLLAEIAADGDQETLGAESPASAYVLAQSPLLIALALGAMALVWPLFWLALVLVGSLILVGVERTWIHGRQLEPADLIVFPARAIASSAKWLRGRLSQPAPLSGTVRYARWLGLALLGTAAVGGVSWMIARGGEGLVAAMRLAVLAHALRIFAFLTCVSLVRRGLSMPARKIHLERALSSVPGSGLTAAPLFTIGLVTLCAVLLPRDAWWPAANFRGAVNSLPTGLRDTIHGWQQSLAETESRAVVECTAKHGLGGWLPPTSLLLPDGTLAVSLNFDRRSPPSDRSLAVLMLALQNQLAPTVKVVVIHTVKPKARIRYELVESATPTTDITAVTDRVTPSTHSDTHLAAVRLLSTDDLIVALRCSAAAF